MSVKSMKELYENRDSEIESNGSNKSNSKLANKKQTSVLPPISVLNRKQIETSIDSGKSSHTSSRRGSVIEVRDNTDENPYIDLVIYGKSISIQSTSSDKSTPSRNSSRISDQKSPLNIEKCDVSYNQKSSPDERHIRRTKRTNSLPGIINKYPIEASPTQPIPKYGQSSKKSSKRRSTDKETRSVECVFNENLSLDLSRMSDFADSEDEALDVNFKQKISKNQNLSRRRRSIEKDKILSTRSSASKNSSGASSRIITRRSSLQSFSPRGLSFTTAYDGCTTHSKTPSPYFWNNQNTATSSSNDPNSKTSKVAYSPVSPDYTSEPSTCETSPCKLSPNDSVVPDRLLYVPINSNQATISPASQMPCLSSSSSCYTSWMEKSIESEFTQHNGQDTNGVITNNGTPIRERGEWDSFWKNYKSVGALPKPFYDNCPTPFYQENQEVYINNNYNGEATSTDFNGERVDESINNEEVSNRSNEVKCINLSKCEVQEIIKCAHRLAEILTLALEKSEQEVRKVESKAVQVNIGDGMKRSKSETKISDNKKQVSKFSLENKKSLPLVLELNEVSFKNDPVDRKEYESVMNRSLHCDVESRFLLEDPKDVHL